MNDPEIRRALIAYLASQLCERSDCLIVEEINVCRGSSRVDLAVVSDTTFHGYEIKSRVDNLSRLSTQLCDYTAVFEHLTVVTGVNHLTGILKDVPAWCGILLASRVGGQVTIEEFRASQTNLHRDRYAMAELLWREEALAILERRELDRGVRSKPRAQMWARLAQELSVCELQQELCDALRRRNPEWRVDARQVFPREKVSRLGRRRKKRRARTQRRRS